MSSCEDGGLDYRDCNELTVLVVKSHHHRRRHRYHPSPSVCVLATTTVSGAEWMPGMDVCVAHAGPYGGETRWWVANVA